MFRVVLLDKINHDGPRLEQANHLAVGEAVSHSRDPAIRVDLQEPRLFLRVLGDVDVVHLVRQTDRWSQLGLPFNGAWGPTLAPRV